MLKEVQTLACRGRFQRRMPERQERLSSLSSLISGAPVDTNSIETIARQQERARLLAKANGLSHPENMTGGRRILEAVVGRDDRLPRNFLTVGSRTADAVCRVATSTSAGERSLGTGFAVEKGLILTNNHVLPSKTAAARGQVEFGYWSDATGTHQNRIALSLDPDRLFLTDLQLDFTLVALEARAIETIYKVFGSIEILPRTGKVLIGEAVNIVQHGEGGPQSVSLRDNLVVDVFDDWVHYTSDTAEGTSGAPVLNDQWQLAALHHAAFEYTASDGSPVLVNEGARISSIAQSIARMLN
jgi:endonuclease G